MAFRAGVAEAWACYDFPLMQRVKHSLLLRRLHRLANNVCMRVRLLPVRTPSAGSEVRRQLLIPALALQKFQLHCKLSSLL